jgi:hypothetical protein
LDTSALANFIANFEWSVGAWDISQVEHRIKENLVESGCVSDAEGARALFDRLFVVVFRKLCSPDPQLEQFAVNARCCDYRKLHLGLELTHVLRYGPSSLQGVGGSDTSQSTSRSQGLEFLSPQDPVLVQEECAWVQKIRGGNSIPA